MALVVLGLDLALNTGWSVGDRVLPTASGLWKLPGFTDRQMARSCGSLYSAVLTTIRAYRVQVVALETALRGVRKKDQFGKMTSSAHTDRVLTLISGAAQAAAVNGGAYCLDPVAPATWRKAVLGQAFPDDPKLAAIAYWARFGLVLEDHNVAEAGCVMVWGQGQALTLR